MRYGSYANEDGQPEQEWHATVQNDSAIESQRLALRHARAMAAVLRAAKAEHRLLMQLNRQYETPGPGGDVFTALHKRWALARQKSVDATARLVAVENEVGDGQ